MGLLLRGWGFAAGQRESLEATSSEEGPSAPRSPDP